MVTTAGRIVAPKIRGQDQLVHAVEDVRRACEHGILSVLVTDEGLLWVLNELKKAGDLPKELILKGSVMLGSVLRGVHLRSRVLRRWLRRRVT